MKPSRSLIVALLLVALVAVLAACGGEPEPAATTAPQPTTAPAATDTSIPPTDAPEPTAQTPEEEPTAASSGEADKSGPNLDNLSSTSDLSSYRASMTMRFTGTAAGEPVDGSIELLMEYTAEPQAQHIQMSGVGLEEAESTGVIDMYQLEDKSYVQFGDQWLSVPATEGVSADMGFMNPNEILDDTCGWQQQDDTEYEGIEALYWTLSPEDAEKCMLNDVMDGIGGISEASGELYVAKEGNYVIHMSMLITGTDIEASVGTEEQALDEGSMELTFDMRDVNQPFTIEIPEEALASGTLPEDVPIPEDAEELSNAFGMITYSTAQTPAEIADYYKAQMPANGWTEDSADELSGMFMLEYGKDGRTASLTINADDSGKTSVLIMLQEPEE